jgi:hypothetical protein
MAEAGVADFVVTGWFAFAAPAGTPDAITQRMSSALQEILQRKDTLEALAPHGVEVAHLPPAQLKDHISKEAKRFGDLVHSSIFSRVEVNLYNFSIAIKKIAAHIRSVPGRGQKCLNWTQNSLAFSSHTSRKHPEH